MEKKGTRKLRRVISWILAAAMVVATFNFGGIPGARTVEAKDYASGEEINDTDIQEGDVINKGAIIKANVDSFRIYFGDNDQTGTVVDTSYTTTDDYKVVAIKASLADQYKDFVVVPLNNFFVDTKISLKDISFEFDGTAKAPVVQYKASEESDLVVLEEGVDYTVFSGDSSATKANAAGEEYSFTIRGQGNYRGEATFTWKITPVVLSDSNTKLSFISIPFDGDEKTPIVQYKKPSTDAEGYTAVDLVEGEDYTVSTDSKTSATDAGVDYTISITGIGNYSGSAGLTWEITPKTLTSDNLKLSDTSYVWDGTNKSPVVQVKLSETKTVDLELGADKDYTVSDSSTTTEDEVGKYSIEVTGANNYAGTVSLNWKIDPIALTFDNTIIVEESYQYDGTAKTPVIKYKKDTDTDAVLLVADTDYEVKTGSTTSAKDVSSEAYSIVFEGINHYSGEVTKNWTISPIVLDKDNTQLDFTTVVYDGTAKTPVVQYKASADADPVTLVKDKDYTVSEDSTTSETNAGEYTIKITGKGNYSGSATLTWKIEPFEITVANINLNKAAYYYDATAKTPVVQCAISANNIKDLVFDTDYEVDENSTRFSTNAGQFTINITGKGNYKGNVTKTWIIKKIPVIVTPTANQKKVYGQDDGVLKYTVAVDASRVDASLIEEGSSLTIPTVDLDAAGEMFKNGALGRASGEAVGKCTFTLGTLKAENTNYDILMADTDVTFEITRKQLDDDDILVVAVGASDKTAENGFEFVYDGEATEPQFIVYYTDRKVDDEGNAISVSFDANNPTSVANDVYKLTADKDYRFDGETTYKEPTTTPFIISFRGDNNYQGHIFDKWSIIKGTFEAVAKAYSGVYDGEEHNALRLSVENPEKYKHEEISYSYALLPTYKFEEGITYDNEKLATVWAGMELLDPYTDPIQIVDYIPTIKNVNVDENYNTIPYVVFYKIQIHGYEDLYGYVQPKITKVDVQLEADDPGSKVYDNDPTTDPELTYQDFADQLIDDDDKDTILSSVKISREGGQEAGKHQVHFNLDDLNKTFTNYNFTENSVIFEILKRNANISVGDYTKVYSDEMPEISIAIEKAGDAGVAEDEGVLAEDIDALAISLAYSRDGVAYSSDLRKLDAGVYDIIVGAVSNSNYNIEFSEPGILTVEPKPLDDENVVLRFDGKDGLYDSNIFEYKFTGEEYKPVVTLEDIIAGVDYFKYGKEGTAGAQNNPDYRITGVEYATEIGAYDVEIEGVNNYSGTIKATWSILPMSDVPSKVYNGQEQSPDLLDDFDPTQFSNLFTITYSADGENYYAEMPTFKDVVIDSDGNVSGYDMTYKITYNGEEYGYVDDAKTIPYTSIHNVLFVIEPAPLEVKGLFAEKSYDGNTTVSFDKMAIDGVTVPAVGGNAGFTEKFNISFTADLEKEDSNVALGLSVSEYRKVRMTDDQIDNAVLEAAEGTNFKPSNYELVFVDDAGYVDGIGAKVEPKILYNVDSPNRDADAYISAKAVDRMYDGTANVEGAEIKVVTGVDDDQITFNSLTAKMVDPNKNVLFDADDNIMPRAVKITGVAQAGNNTYLENYIYCDEEGGSVIYYPLADAVNGVWKGHVDSTVTISPAMITIAGKDITKVYDGKEVKASDVKISVTGFGVIDDNLANYYKANKDEIADVKAFAGTVKNVGTYTSLTIVSDEFISLLEADKNYIYEVKNPTVKITPKAVTVKVNDAAKTVGESDPTFSYQITGMVNGESLKNIKVTRDAGEKAGTYNIKATCSANPNYSITFINGKFSIKAKQTPGSGSKKGYSSEWVDGQWYDAKGGTSYKPKGSWKKNSSGKWFEDTSGWYPKAQWQKIDGKWYYFGYDGYMASSEWIDGYWIDNDGVWRYQPHATWQHDSKGWWYGDTSGWYAVNGWHKIDGKWYYFNSSGYILTSQSIGGYWVGRDGAYVPN